VNRFLDVRPASHECAVLIMMLCLVSAHTEAQEKKAAVEKPAAAEVKLEAKIIQRKLRARTDLAVDKLPLQEVVKKLAEFHEIPIRLDKQGLKKAKVELDAPVTVNIQNYTLSAALKHILKDFGLHFGVVDGAVLITNTPPEPEEQAVVADAANVEQVRVVQQMAVNEALQLQQTPQYLALLRAELNFAKHVCQATPEQMQALREELDKKDNNPKGQPPQNAAANKRVLIQRQVRNGQVQGDPLQLARDRLAGAVKTCFTSEQATRFQEELDQRTADDRRSAARNLVARLDREMILSATQRDQITESLLAHWNDAWCSSLQMFMYNDQFFPAIPDAHVVKFLNETQKKIWVTIPKNQGQMVFNGFMGGIFGQEVLWNEDDADAPAKKPDE